MKRVFVVNEPLKRDPSGEFGRAIDLRPAEEYGNLVFLSDAGEPPHDPTAWLPRMIALISTFNADNDYLLPVGHPAMIAAASALIGRMTKACHINVLLWRGTEIGYRVSAIPLFLAQSPENHHVKAKA